MGAGNPHEAGEARPNLLLGREEAWTGMPGAVTSAGARTPEELEMLFEDALLMRGRTALAALFAAGAVLVAGDARPARGEEIARVALATWDGGDCYVADPRRVLLARDIALIVTERGANVMRRGRNGAWRYAIVLQSSNDETGSSERSPVGKERTTDG